jgi:CrcB protein
LKARLLVFTFIGGAVGSVLRYGISLNLSLPIWLWTVNLFGALVLGFVQVNKRFSGSELQALVATGFAGGFTTMSSLITFGMLGNDPNFIFLAQQIGAGVAVYWLGRILGGERSWPNTW